VHCRWCVIGVGEECSASMTTAGPHVQSKGVLVDAEQASLSLTGKGSSGARPPTLCRLNQAPFEILSAAQHALQWLRSANVVLTGSSSFVC